MTLKSKKLKGLGWDDKRAVGHTKDKIDKMVAYLKDYNIDINNFFSTEDIFLTTLEANHFDFVILDIIDDSSEKQDINKGFELARSCRDKFPDIPVIFFSGDSHALANSTTKLRQPYCIFSKHIGFESLGHEVYKYLQFCGLTQSKIFIGHGHSKDWTEISSSLQTKYKIECEAFDLAERAGKSIPQVLDSMKKESGLAILVMTAEDMQDDGTGRSRQNVVHEIGFFQGHLGFSKTIILIEEGCQSFSNIEGTIVIPFKKDKISSIFERIENVLKREGFF